MLARLTEHEHGLVREVLEAAESKYLQEREINPKTVFNLMKVLSAYNEVLPKHGLSPTGESRMLNYLVHINKRYDPQSKEEWKALVSVHLTVNGTNASGHRSISRSRSRANSTIIDTSLAANRLEHTSRISQFNPISTNRKKQPPPAMQEPSLDRSMSNGRIMQPKSHMKVSQQSRHPFDPKFDNKQNSQIHINSNYVHCDKTAVSEHGHTTFDSSFQQHQLSKVMLIEQPLTEEILQMNERARLSHEVNLKTKVFLILKATCLIHDQARNRLRTILRYCRMKQLKHYFGLVQLGVSVIKQQNAKLLKAQQFHLRSVKCRVFELLRALKHLQISRQQHFKYSANWLINEFAMWAVSRSFLADEQLQKKYEYFRANGKHHELSLLFKIFGGVQPTSHEDLVEFYRNAQLSSKRRVLSAWKIVHKSERRSVRNVHQQHLLRRAMAGLREYQQQQASSKQALEGFTILRREELLRQAFQSLADGCRQSKLNRTKEAYLVARHHQFLKTKYFDAWQEGALVAKSQQARLQETKLQLEEHYSRELKALVFIGGFKQYWEWRRQKKAKLAKAVAWHNTQLRERVFRGLVAQVLERKKAEYIQSKHQLHSSAKFVLSSWRRATGTAKLTRLLERQHKKQVFALIGQLSQANHKLIEALSHHRLKSMGQVLRRLSQFATKQRVQLQERQQTLQAWLALWKKRAAMKELCIRTHTKATQRRSLAMKSNALAFGAGGTSTKNSTTEVGSITLRQRPSSRFLKQLKAFCENASFVSTIRRKSAQLTQLNKNRAWLQFSSKCRCSVNRKKLQASRCKKLLRTWLSNMKQLEIRKYENNSYELAGGKLRRFIEQSVKKQAVSSIRRVLEVAQAKMMLAASHHRTKLQQTSLLLLKSIIIVRKQIKRSHSKLTDKIRAYRKQKALAQFLKGLTNYHLLTLTRRLERKRVEIITKKTTIKCIRQFAVASIDAKQRRQATKLAASFILINRLKLGTGHKHQIQYMEKRLALRSFMGCMYARIYSRKLLDIACHHYYHKLMRTAIDSWRIDYANSSVESGSRTPATEVAGSRHPKPQIMDMLQYYTKS